MLTELRALAATLQAQTQYTKGMTEQARLTGMLAQTDTPQK